MNRTAPFLAAQSEKIAALFAGEWVAFDARCDMGVLEAAVQAGHLEAPGFILAMVGASPEDSHVDALAYDDALDEFYFIGDEGVSENARRGWSHQLGRDYPLLTIAAIRLTPRLSRSDKARFFKRPREVMLVQESSGHAVWSGPLSREDYDAAVEQRALLCHVPDGIELRHIPRPDATLRPGDYRVLTSGVPFAHVLVLHGESAADEAAQRREHARRAAEGKAAQMRGRRQAQFKRDAHNRIARERVLFDTSFVPGVLARLNATLCVEDAATLGLYLEKIRTVRLAQTLRTELVQGMINGEVLDDIYEPCVQRVRARYTAYVENKLIKLIHARNLAAAKEPS